MATYARELISGAQTIAALARQSGGGRIVMFENAGVSAINDRILAVSGTRLASEAGALASAMSNARYGASFLQAAKSALDSISEKLDRMKQLAETISPATTPTTADGGATSNNLASAAAAASAVTNVKAAIGQLDSIRGAVRGAGVRISAAVDNARSMQNALDETRGRRGAVDVTVETLRVLGEKIIDQGAVAVPDVSLQLFRRILLDSGNETSRPRERPVGATSDEGGDGATGGARGGKVQSHQTGSAD